ncbi:hypothetical protein HPB50_013153 [Hyalomma asiaticum]|uniref:Uncharacterized protein n=1 Tax=Hyalomma asiaticum TaxID=266040 RepID=A0ACB7SVV6_HYAAI|nr:hypothetical protein HPB50_013153 [Hyalomma asiaticum]
MRELVLVAALVLCCALHLVTSAALGGDGEATESRDQWLQSSRDLEPEDTESYSLPWMGTPPSSGYYRWHDDISGGRYTAGELVEMLRRLAASRKLRQVRVANKAIRFGISKRSLRQRF